MSVRGLYSSLDIRARSGTVCAGMVYRHFFGQHEIITATSFWPTGIPVCRKPLNSCKNLVFTLQCTKFDELIVENHQNHCVQIHFLGTEYAKNVFSAQDLAGGAYSTPSGPLAGFNGPTSKEEREGRGA